MAKPRGVRGPRLPKLSVIERLTQQPVQCVQEMMAVLTCFKDNNYSEQKCAGSMRALSECVQRQDASEKKGGGGVTGGGGAQKSTVFYHLKRLYYMQRRR
jgi:hypothetical protein